MATINRRPASTRKPKRTNVISQHLSREQRLDEIFHKFNEIEEIEKTLQDTESDENINEMSDPYETEDLLDYFDTESGKIELKKMELSRINHLNKLLFEADISRSRNRKLGGSVILKKKQINERIENLQIAIKFYEDVIKQQNKRLEEHKKNRDRNGFELTKKFVEKLKKKYSNAQKKYQLYSLLLKYINKYQPKSLEKR